MLVISFTTLASDIPIAVTFSPGGPSDKIWRTVEPYTQKELPGDQLVTSYILGAGGVIGANTVAESKVPSLLLLSSAHAIALTVNPSVIKYKLSDFDVLAYYGNIPMVLLTANPEHKSLASFSTWCRDSSLTYGSGGVGSATHLFGALVARDLGCKPVVHVPYKGAVNTQLDLVANRLDYMVDFPLNASGMVSTGKLNAIAIVGSSSKSNIMPEVVDKVSPSAILGNWHMIVANSAMSDDLKTKLKVAFDKARENTELRSRLESLGITDLNSKKDNKWLSNQESVYRQFISDTH